jgi:hypothetical protein
MGHVSDQLAIDGLAANAMPMPGVRTATLPNTARSMPRVQPRKLPPLRVPFAGRTTRVSTAPNWPIGRGAHTVAAG